MVVGDGHQGGGQERFQVGRHLPPEPVEGPDTRDAEEDRRQPDRGGGLAELHDREVSQNRVEHVLILGREPRHDLRQRKPDEVDQRKDLVDPQSGVEPIEPEDQGDRQQSDHPQDRPPGGLALTGIGIGRECSRLSRVTRARRPSPGEAEEREPVEREQEAEEGGSPSEASRGLAQQDCARWRRPSPRERSRPMRRHRPPERHRPGPP